MTLNILSRRKRMLEATPARANSDPSGFIASWSNRLRRAVRRNRVLVVTLFAVGALVAVLVGVGSALPSWIGTGQTIGSPLGARYGHAAAWYEDQGEMVIFGGFGTAVNMRAPGSPSSIENLALDLVQPQIEREITKGDTWVYTTGSRRWGNRTSSAIHAPSPRGFAAMAYDGARRNLVLFGGGSFRNNHGVFGDTWTWDGKDWTLHSPPKPTPEPRQNAVMFYDAHRKVVVLFGGRGAPTDSDPRTIPGTPLNDTWVWNGSAWKIMPPEGAPSGRHSAAAAYDVCRAEGVMFGGIGLPETPGSNFVPQPSQTWTWDGYKWHQEAPTVSPPARVGAAMTYTLEQNGATSERVLLYGGVATTETGGVTVAIDADVWRWEGGTKTWEKLGSEITSNGLVPLASHAELAPPPRAFASFTPAGSEDYIDARTIYMYGGTPSITFRETSGFSWAPQLALGDFHMFTDTNEGEGGGDDTSDPGWGPFFGSNNNPLGRRCLDPVPISTDEAAVAGQVVPQGTKFEVREGMGEIGQLPLLVGTNWPYNQRNTHLSGNPRPANPDYTPPPACPNRVAGSSTTNGQENGKNSYLRTDPKRNRIYQFFICDSDRGINQQGQTNPAVYNLLIQAHDGTTLGSLGSVVVPTPPNFSITSLIDDPDRGRFLIRDPSNSSNLVELSKDLIDKSLDPRVAKFESSKNSTHWFTHPITGRAKMFFVANAGVCCAPGFTVVPRLGQWDVQDNRLDWEATLTGCANLADLGIYQGFAIHTGDNVFTACLTTHPQYGAVKIPITQNADGTESAVSAAVEAFPGPVYVSSVWGDPVSKRLLLHSRWGGHRVWIFDGGASRWVGRSGIWPSNSTSIQWGFDQESGRLYAHAPDDVSTFYFTKARGGVFQMDTHLTPVSQPLSFPQFASPLGSPVAFLPPAGGSPRKVFIRQAGGTMKKHPNWETIEFENEMHYTVLADDIPIPEEAELAGLDALTVPVAENPNKTEVNFDAEGSGYGIRLRSVGGIWSVLRPFGSGDNLEIFQNDTTSYLAPACLFPDRELMAGWVPQARLSDLDALAVSSGLEVDSNSKTDLRGPSSRCQPTASAAHFPPSAKPVFDQLWPLWQMVQFEANKAVSTGSVETGRDADGSTTPLLDSPLDTPLDTLQQGKDKDGNPTLAYKAPTSSSWDSHFKEVVCVGDALKTYQAAVGNIYGSSKCEQTKGLVQATARGSATGGGSATGAGPLAEAASQTGFSVAEGYSTVRVERDPEKGVVVTSNAVAKGIQIPGLYIARVETTATAWSNGRPGEERASFERHICGVITSDGTNGKCLSSKEQNDLVTNWNTQWRGHSKIFLPAPDPEFYQGSPGGYIVGVIKPLTIVLEDEMFARDNLREVPGLEIHFYKNTVTLGEGRQTLQLAGVRAIAGFGVQCNPDHFYSPQTQDCVAIPDDLPEEEYFEEGEDEFFEEEESDLDGEWIPVEAIGPTGPSLGSRIGRVLGRLPVLSRLPIREMGEALLGASVWLLLLFPLGLASRRFAALAATRKV